MNIILNHTLLKKEIYKKFENLGDFCAAIGVHRNSLSNYLSGKVLLPEVVEKTLTYLKIQTQDIFLLVKDKPATLDHKIASIVETIVIKYPELSVVLFGSRARGTERKYSDIDLGLIGKESLHLDQWSNIRNLVDEKSDDLPYKIDLVDLRRADDEFLDAIKSDVKFLGGNPVNYLSLIK